MQGGVGLVYVAALLPHRARWPVPDPSTLKLTKRLGPGLLEELNAELLALAVERRALRSRRLRVDTTVVEADIRGPTDSGLCAQGAHRRHRRGLRDRRRPERSNPGDDGLLSGAIAKAKDAGMRVDSVLADRGFGTRVGDHALRKHEIKRSVIPRRGRAAPIEATGRWRRRYRFRNGLEDASHNSNARACAAPAYAACRAPRPGSLHEVAAELLHQRRAVHGTRERVPGKAPTPDYDRARGRLRQKAAFGKRPREHRAFSSARGWPTSHDDYEERPGVNSRSLVRLVLLFVRCLERRRVSTVSVLPKVTRGTTEVENLET